MKVQQAEQYRTIFCMVCRRQAFRRLIGYECDSDHHHRVYMVDVRHLIIAWCLILNTSNYERGLRALNDLVSEKSSSRFWNWWTRSDVDIVLRSRDQGMLAAGNKEHSQHNPSRHSCRTTSISERLECKAFHYAMEVSQYWLLDISWRWSWSWRSRSSWQFITFFRCYCAGNSFTTNKNSYGRLMVYFLFYI